MESGQSGGEAVLTDKDTVCVERQTRGNNRLYYLSVCPDREKTQPYLSDLCAGKKLGYEDKPVKQVVHMLPQTEATGGSGCLWLHCVCANAIL